MINKKAERLYNKIISLLLIVTLVAYQVAIPLYAQEVLPSPTPTENSQPESNTVSPVPSQTNSNDSASTVQTGDSSSAAQSEQSGNTDVEQVEGNINSDACGISGETDCPVSVDQNTQGQTGTESDANSGENSNTNEVGDTMTDTGDSTATSTSDNDSNTAIVELENQDESTPSGEIEEANSESGEQDDIEIKQNAESDSSATSDANTGANTSEAGDDATINTGDAIATSVNVNLLNTSIIGSEFELLLRDLYGDVNGDINLNELWKMIEDAGADSASLSSDEFFSILLQKYANLNSTATATAQTGSNTAVAGDEAMIITGDATAVATVFNMANLNIVGSHFLFAIINIFGNYQGNIIVPSLDKFMQTFLSLQNTNSADFQLNHTDWAQVDSTSGATATTGENQATAEETASIHTGNNTAVATNTSYANLLALFSNFYFLTLNNFGFWNGSVLGWGDPASNTAQDTSNAQYGSEDQVNPPSAQQADIESEAENAPGGSTILDISNIASVTTSAIAKAICGGNNASGKTVSITTGNCAAFAHVFNLVNSTFIGSRLFMPILNIFGSWQGNLIFAYPDLAVTLSSDKEDAVVGDTIVYHVSYNNRGYEDATNAAISVSLPGEAALVSTSGPQPQGGGSGYTFSLGNVARGASGSFTIEAVIENSPAGQSQKDGALLSQLLEWIAPVAQAAQHGKSLTTTAAITTHDPESDTSNNTSSTTLFLNDNDHEGEQIAFTPPTDEYEYIDQTGTADEIANGVPYLTVESRTNVGSHINAGDTIKFEVDTHNGGSGISHNTYLYQEIYDQAGGLLVTQSLPLQNIDPQSGKRISFDLTTPKTLPQGNYESVIVAEGQDQFGNYYTSDDSVNPFAVRSRGLSFVKAAHAAGPIEKVNKVLGVKTGEFCSARQDWLPYLIAASMTGLWYVETRRRRRQQKELLAAISQKGPSGN